MVLNRPASEIGNTMGDVLTFDSNETFDVVIIDHFYQAKGDVWYRNGSLVH